MPTALSTVFFGESRTEIRRTKNLRVNARDNVEESANGSRLLGLERQGEKSPGSAIQISLDGV